MPKYRIVVAYEVHEASLEDAVEVAGGLKEATVLSNAWVEAVKELDE